ncbi:hypothetical protein MmiHf6_13540 [Methanimicrococcus hongohii]|uniref:Uncharacterized protein n=1 Tax=Methanimicrococcus hongohii TaxID=3028295 RepID=A0AA96V0G0_9EURY|nr:hypothetical protein MmiHf6_13540 [Methanimicrococcus sp. Hf6]
MKLMQLARGGRLTAGKILNFCNVFVMFSELFEDFSGTSLNITYSILGSSYIINKQFACLILIR